MDRTEKREFVASLGQVFAETSMVVVTRNEGMTVAQVSDLRRRMRAYEQPWQEVLTCLRDDLEPAEVAVVTGATLAMLNATALGTAGVSRERLAGLLRTMALAALLAPQR